ncbi:Uncharacterized protein conserved in bacteria [Alteromonadaceae bacterium Bs31]|nr:Uncharacterized protein conserved in bacteria [Alteromonadaceae bacterium Bs31]
MYNASENRIASQLQRDIESELDRIGVLSRVFSRAKSIASLDAKINRSPKKYSSGGKKIQDLFGIRVAVYFPDDSHIAQKAIRNMFQCDEGSSTIDTPKNDMFSATRCNLVFRLPQEISDQSAVISSNELVDSTFEVQFRTVLSEGWHEVEHDLRYKHKEDWGPHDDLSRALNGIYASLETADWSMMKLFEELAYRHYKAAEWSQMIRAKFRLRIRDELSDTVKTILDTENNIGKKLYRVDRGKFIVRLLEDRIRLPITLDNILYLCNHYYIKSSLISDITPDLLKQICSELE